MRFMKKLLAIMLAVVLTVGLWGNVRAEAAETAVPKISLKYVNNKTGVKITIGKTPGADAYQIYLKGYGDSYADYWSDYLKNEWWREVDIIKLDGSKKRTYTIDGLPKGTYTIKVEALKKEVDEGRDYFYTMSYSEEKTIKIKAAKSLTNEEKKYDFSNAKAGDIIVFGSYEQDGIMSNGKEDIEWIVLSKTKSKMLVVSRYALDALPYDAVRHDTTWENSTLRKWLNGNFYKTAFTKAERNMIAKTKLKNADNEEYGTDGGNDTKDKVFLLSLDDVLKTGYGFSSASLDMDMARRCAPTKYSVSQGIIQLKGVPDEYLTIDGIGGCGWWLRFPGEYEQWTSYIDSIGRVDDRGYNSNGVSLDAGYFNFIGVRPALYIDL